MKAEPASAGPSGATATTALEAAAELIGLTDPKAVEEALLQTAMRWTGATWAALVRCGSGPAQIEAEVGAHVARPQGAGGQDQAIAEIAGRALSARRLARDEESPRRIALPVGANEDGLALVLEGQNLAHADTLLLAGLARVGASALANAGRVTALQDSVARSEPLYDANVMGVFSWNLDGEVLDANNAFLEIVGYDRDDLTEGRVDWARMTPPEFRARDEMAITELLASGKARPFEKEYIRKDGSRVAVMLGVGRYLASQNEGVCIVIDISDLKATQARLAETLGALQDSQARLESALQAGRMGVWRRKLPDDELAFSPEMNALLGYPPDRPLTRSDVRRGIVDDPDNDVNAVREKAIASGQSMFEVEFAYRRPDTDEVRWLWIRNEIVRNAQGEAEELVGLVIDITERKQQEERQQLLLNELNHRVKNTLTVVSGIVDQTLRNTDSPAAFSKALNGRLQALSKSHNLLTDRIWEGASVREILEGELQAWDPRAGGQVRLDGEELRVGPKGVVTLGLVTHELVTNAVRHGALSTPAGRVEVTWVEDANRNLHIVWRERGGPPVTAPSRRGFGMTLLERGLAREFVGGIRLVFAPEGLECDMRLSLERMAQT